MVGMHPFTAIPLGTLATKPMREARKQAKALFEPLWRDPGATMTRKEAYAWLAQIMGLEPADAHFGMFSIEQCDRFMAIMVAANSGTPKGGFS